MNNFLSEEENQENTGISSLESQTSDEVIDNARQTASNAREGALNADGEESELSDLDNPNVDIFAALGGSAPDSAFAVGGKREIGFGEKLRKGMEAETGEEYSTAGAVASRLTPFAAKIQKVDANIRSRTLEEIYDGSAFDDINSVSPKAIREFGWTDGSKSPEEAKERRLQSYLDVLGDDAKAIAGSEEYNQLSPDDKLKVLRPLAEEELRKIAEVKQSAQKTLSNTTQGTLSKIGTGAIENTGYTLEYVVGSILGGGPVGGFMLAGSAAAGERASDLSTNDYEIDKEGNLQNKYNAYGEDEAFARGVIGGFTEAGVESALGWGLGKIGGGIIKGIAKVPGANNYLIEPTKSLVSATKGAINKVPGAQMLAKLGRGYNSLSRITSQQEMPMELLEENVQSFFDDVVGLAAKKGENESFGKEWENYKRDTLNWDTQRDILLGMVGTMVLQGAGGAYIDKKRRAPGERRVAEEAKKKAVDYSPNEARGRLELLGFGDKLNSLSDSQAVFLANLSHTMEKFTPEELLGILSRQDARVQALAMEIDKKRSWEYDQQLAENGESAEFTPDKNSNGLVNTLPGERTDDNGDKHETRVILDTVHGVGIRDNMTDEGDAFTVVDNRGNKIGVSSMESALIAANMLVKQNAVKNAENKQKAEYISQIITQNFGADAQNKFQLRNTWTEFIDQMRANGASEDTIQRFRQEQKKGTPGVRLDDGRVFVILDNVNSPMEAAEVLQHEVIGHDSVINKLGGKEGVVKFLRSLDSKTMRDYTAAVVSQTKQRMLNHLKQQGVAITPELEAQAEQDAMEWATTDEGIQELFARIVERRRHNPAIWQKLAHRMRERAREKGANKPINDNDLEVILSQMEKESGKVSFTGQISVVPSMSVGGMTFLRFEDNTTPETDADVGDVEGGDTTISDDDYNSMVSAVSNLMTARDGATPSQSKVSEAVGQILGAESWDEAAQILTSIGKVDEATYNLFKRAYGAEGGISETGNGTAQAQAQSEQAQGVTPPTGEEARPVETGKAPTEVGGEVNTKGEIEKLYKKDSNRSVRADRISDVAARNWSDLDVMGVGESITTADGRKFTKTAAKGETDAVWKGEDGKSIKQLALAETSGDLAEVRAKEEAARKEREERVQKRNKALKEANKLRAGLYQRFINEWQLNPNSIFAYWHSMGGKLFEMPETDKKGRFINDPAADTLNNFFDGLKGVQRELWKNRIFGYERGGSSSRGNDVVSEEVARHTNNEELVNNYDEILDTFLNEYEEFLKWKQSGAVSREEREASDRAEAEEAAEREFYLAELADKEVADKEYNNAFVEVEKYDNGHPFIKMFSDSELSKLQEGDTIRFDHADIEWVVVSYDKKRGILTVKEPNWVAEERAFSEGTDLMPPKEMRYVVTKNGISEYKEEEKPNEPEDKRRTSKDVNGDEQGKRGESTPAKDKADKGEVTPPKDAGKKTAREDEKSAKTEKKAEQKPKKTAKRKSTIDLGDATKALDDALDGLDDVFGATKLSTFGATKLSTFSATDKGTDTDPDAFTKQTAAVVKVVNVLNSKGFNTFKDLVTVIYEKKPDLYPKMKPHLRGIWNYIADQKDLEDVSRKEAEAIFAALENEETTPPEDGGDDTTPPTDDNGGDTPPPTTTTPPTQTSGGSSGSSAKSEGETKAKGDIPVVDKPLPPPEPTSGRTRKFTEEEANKIAFDLGGSEEDQKEVADLIGQILFADPNFAIGNVKTTLQTGEKTVAPVATAPRELTDEERKHNEGVILSLIKKLSEMGHKTFDKLARAIAKASYKLYRAVKNTLYTHWQHALDRGVDVDDSITRKQANEILNEIDDEINDSLQVVPEREDGRTQWSLEDQRNAYLVLTNREFAVKNPKAVEIANEMLAQGVPVSAIVQDWWKKDDAAYWPVTGLKIEKASDAAALFQMLSNPYVEIFKVIYLDKNRRVLEGRVAAIGSRDKVGVSLESVTENIPKGTVGVIISHNHPTGNVIPSGPASGQKGDVDATTAWAEEFAQKGLLLLDHIVTDTDRFTSFASGVSKGQTKVYGNFHFDYKAEEYWNPKIVNRGIGLYDYPPLPWELVPREQFGLGYYDGKHTKSIATYFAQQLSTHNQDRSWIVLMNDDFKVTGIIRVPTAEAVKTKTPLNELVGKILESHQEAPNAMIYFGREKFDARLLGDAFVDKGVKISALYSISKGEFIGEDTRADEDKKFKLGGGYEDSLKAGAIVDSRIWEGDAKTVSRRTPKALPLEVPPKSQYTIKPKGEIEDDDIRESGRDGDNASQGDSGDALGGGAEVSQEGEGVSRSGRRRNRGRAVGYGVNLQGEAGGQGSGVGRVLSELPDGAAPVVGGGTSVRPEGMDGEGGAEGQGLHSDGNAEQNSIADGNGATRGIRNPVQLDPGHALTQNANDNFIATQKVVDAWEETSLVKRAERNIEALELLNSLGWTENEDSTRLEPPMREVTLEDKEILASYTGWDGFYEVLYNDDLAAVMKRYEALVKEYESIGIESDEETAINAAVEKTNAARSLTGTEREISVEGFSNYKKLMELIPENVRKEYIAYGQSESAVKLSSNGNENAPAMRLDFSEAILDAVADTGLSGGYFINPTGGWGREVMLSGGRFAQDTNWTLFEPNKFKARILKALFPKANIINESSRSVDITKGFFDFASMVAPFDMNASDEWTYTFGKNIKGLNKAANDAVRLVEKVRPGGLAVFVMPENTSWYESTRESNARLAREIGVAKGRVLGVMRVPAMWVGYKPRNVEELVNVWFVQRETTKMLNRDLFNGPAYFGGVPAETIAGVGFESDGLGNVSGVWVHWDQDRRMSGNEIYYKTMREIMSKANARALADPTSARYQADLAANANLVDRTRHNGETFIDDKGVLRVMESGVAKRILIGKKEKMTGTAKVSDAEFSTDAITGATEAEVLSIQKSYEKLRSALIASIDADRKNAPDAAEKKEALNAAYKAFVDKHGQIGIQAENPGLAAKVILLDRYNGSQVAGHIGFDKKEGVDVLGDIFTKNPFAPEEAEGLPKDAQDALLRSMRDKGYVDAVYIGNMLGISPRAALDKMLEERIAFIDPETQKIVDRSEYLSGLVRHKYEAAKKASEYDGRFIANMEELQRVMKPTLSFDAADERDKPQVTVACGFVPDNIMHDFFRSKNIRGLNKIHYSRTVGKWILNVNWKKVELENPMILGLGSNKGREKSTRIKAWLNQNPTIVNNNGVPDVEATQEVERLFNQLNKDLSDFIESDRSRKAQVERAFWEHLGDDAIERDFSGYELKVPGMSKKWLDNVSKTERWYQRRAVNGVFYGDIQMLDHNVGAGKTAEMIIATMMLKHYGRVRKPMMAVKLATVDQIRQSIVDIFPNAKVLSLDAGDFQPGNRQRTLNLVNEFDGDIILIPHSAFSRMGFSESVVNDIIAMESVDFDADIESVKEEYPELNAKGEIVSKEGRELLKEIEDSRKRALRQYFEILEDAKSNRAVEFDKLGVDYLIVDEAHNFKAVEHYTSKTPTGAKFRGVTIKSSASNAAKAMIVACNYANKLHGGKRGVLFATGTPLSNSFVEAYTMMNYLNPGKMREMGMPRLDAFLNTYCGWKLDFVPREGGFDMEVGLTIRNAKPLSKLLRQTWDVALAGQEFKLTGMPNKKPTIVQVPQSQVQSFAMTAFGELANALAKGEKKPGINKGYLQQYGRWIAINPYLVGIADTSNARARVQAKIIKSQYDNDPTRAHLVFCDIGAPKEFRFNKMVALAGDTYEVETANGRIAFVGPKRSDGTRKITIRQEFKSDMSLDEKTEIEWIYEDNVPGEKTGGAPFNPGALFKALIKAEKLASILFGKNSEISQRKKGKALSVGGKTAKGKLQNGKAIDFEVLVDKQVAELGYDPRLADVTSVEDMKVPPISKKNVLDIYGEYGLGGVIKYFNDIPMYHFYQGHVFDEYSRMRQELLAEGFKPEEIVIVNNKDDFTIDIDKDLNEPDGKIKVVLASKTIQEGVNIQKRIQSIHHHDIPWMPGDKEQRDGRGWRFGNTSKDVYIFNYVTPDSADGKSYSIVAGKQRIFAQVQTEPEHNRLDAAVDESGSLQEMISFAVKDKRIYWRDRLTKQLDANVRIIDGEQKRITENERLIEGYKNQREKQTKIVEETRAEIMPAFNEREAANRVFSIKTPDGKVLTDTAEIIEYIQTQFAKIPRPATPKNANEALDVSNKETIGTIFGLPLVAESGWGIASPGEEDVDELGLYTPRYHITVDGISSQYTLSKLKDRESGKFLPRISDYQIAQLKGDFTKELNPVSESHLVPKRLARIEANLLDLNERLQNAENMLENSRKSLQKAKEPLESIRHRLGLIEQSLAADVNHEEQPIADFLENIDDYMSEAGEDEESSLWKVDGGAVLREGNFDPKKHVTPPKTSNKPDPDGTTPPTGTDGPGLFADRSFALFGTSKLVDTYNSAAFRAQDSTKLRNPTQYDIFSRRGDEDARQYIERIKATYPTAARLVGGGRALFSILGYAPEDRRFAGLQNILPSSGLVYKQSSWRANQRGSRANDSSGGDKVYKRGGLEGSLRGDGFIRTENGVINRNYTTTDFYYPITFGDEIDEVLIRRLFLNLELFGEALGVKKIKGFTRGEDGDIYAIVEAGSISLDVNPSVRDYFESRGYSYGNMSSGFDGNGPAYYVRDGYEVGGDNLIFAKNYRTGAIVPVFADIKDRKKDNAYNKELSNRPLQGSLFADPDYKIEGNGITNAEQDAAQIERGLKAPKKRYRGDEAVMRGAEEIRSNAEFTDTLARVLKKNPRAILAEENIALAQEWLKAKDEYDDVVYSIAEATREGDTAAVRKMNARKRELEGRMATIIEAREKGVGEAARTLRTNRFLFKADYSLAGLVAQATADLGRPLTDIEYTELKDIADKLAKFDEQERDMLIARIKAYADKAIRDMIAQDKVDSIGKPRTTNEMRRMLRKRNDALAQIEVLAFELGGEINALIPTGEDEDFESAKFLNLRKYLRGLAQYHVYHNPNITEEELIAALIEDIAPYFTVDVDTVRQIFSGYGHSWNVDRTEIQRKVSDLSAQSRILQQIEDYKAGELAKLTGPQRSEPSDEVRELTKMRDQLRRQMEREGKFNDQGKHLKTLLDSAKTRYTNMINDIKTALEAGTQLQKREPLGVTDEELETLKAEYARLKEEYDAIWGEGSKMTDEQKRQMVEKGLKRALERWVDKLERAQRGDFSSDPKASKVTSADIEALRKKIEEHADEWRKLKAARSIKDWSDEELLAYAKRRLEAVNRALRHWQEAAVTGDISPKKKKDIPFPTEEMRKEYERIQEQRNRAYRQILDMREHLKNKETPLGLGYVKEYLQFFGNSMRSLMATADFSAMMRQTAPMTLAHPLRAVKTLFKTFGAMMSSSKAIEIDKELRNNPLIREALNNKWLEWRALEGSGGSDDVEMFHGIDAQAITIGKKKDGTERRIALGDIKGLGTVLHASERQYATFINMFSADLYVKMCNSPVYGKNGPTDAQKQMIAAAINMANGSAQLGAKGKQMMAMLTSVFWAPKLAVSRAQIAVGGNILYPFLSGKKGDATMKERGVVSAQMAFESIKAWLAAAAAGFLMLKLFGDDDDKYAQEQAEGMSKLLMTMRPRVGSTRIDFTGGVGQWWQLMQMAYTGVKETATGKKIDLASTYGRSKTGELWRFLQGKLNPLASNTIALWEGKDFVGNEFGWRELAKNSAIPLAGRDIWEAATNDNNGLGRGLLMAPFILIGAGGTTYDIDRYKTAKETFKSHNDEYESALEEKDRARAENIKEKYPDLANRKRIEALFNKAKETEQLIKRREKKGLQVPQMLRDKLEKQQADALEAFRAAR